MPDMSFLPEDYLERRAQRRTNLISLVLFVLVTSGVVAAFVVTDRQRREVFAHHGQVCGQFADAAKRLEQLEELEKQRDRMIAKSQVTHSLCERLWRSNLLAELTNNMPESLAWLELSLDTRVLKPKRPPAATMLEAAKQAKAAADAKKAAADKPPEPEVNPTEVTILLSGVAPTDLQVSQYMAALSRCSLFNDVSLVFSEEVAIDGVNRRRFRIEMKLNQGLNPADYQPTKVARELKFNPMGDQIKIIAEKPAAPAVPQPQPTPGPTGIVPALDRQPTPKSLRK